MNQSQIDQRGPTCGASEKPRFAGLLTRRQMLENVASGFGLLALTHLLAKENLLAEQPATSSASGSAPGNANPNFAIAKSGGLHHLAKAKRVLQLFMNGGASQVDTFDYRPSLEKYHGQQVDFGITSAATSVPGPVMKCPFPFVRHGESGRWVSGVFPHLAQHVDDLAFLMAMSSKTNVHGPGSYLQNTGNVLPGFPCMGAWLSYGLGSLTDDLPAFVVIPDARGLPYNNTGNFSAGFLPAQYQGTLLRPNAETPVPHLNPPAFAKQITPASEAASLRLLAELNEMHRTQHPGDLRLDARIMSYELAAKMQVAAPRVMDLNAETEETRRLYGLEAEDTAAFGKNCLIARRLLEQGVRFVQVWSGMGGPSKNWDNHTDIVNELPFIAKSVDLPIAGLLTDLRRRGLLEDTLVVWTTEFGRMPFTQGSTGRDHNGGAFCSWLTGAGIQGGVAFGETDEFGYQAAVDKTTGYDLHATIMHLLGIDHTRLTFRHNGIERRLTDVHGQVVQAVLR